MNNALSNRKIEDITSISTEYANILEEQRLINKYINIYLLVKEKKKRIVRSISIDLELWGIFKERCKSLNISMSDVLEHLILLFIEATNNFTNSKSNSKSISVTVRKVNSNSISAEAYPIEYSAYAVRVDYSTVQCLCPKCGQKFFEMIDRYWRPEKDVLQCPSCKTAFNVKGEIIWEA